MSQAEVSQTSFNGGAISPYAEGRRDIAAYPSSVRTMKNFLPLPMGPAQRRSGTRFVAEAADSGSKSRLVPFEFSNEQSYILEFSALKIRIFSPSGSGGYVIPAAQSFTSATGNPHLGADAIRFLAPHYFADGSGPYRLTTTGTLPPATPTLAIETDYYVNWKSANAIGLALTSGGADIDLTAAGSGTHTLTPARSDGQTVTVDLPSTVIQSLASPITEAELFQFDYAQQSDSLFIAHKNHHPFVLERWTASGFRLRDVEFQDGPYDPINGSVVTFIPKALAAATEESPIKYREFNAEADVFITGETPADTIVIPNHGFANAEGPFQLIDKGAATTPPTFTGAAITTTSTPATSDFWIIVIDDHQIKLTDTFAKAVSVTPVTITTDGSDASWFIAPAVFTGTGSVLNQTTLSAQRLDINADGEDSRDVRRLWRYREGLEVTTLEPDWSWGATDAIISGLAAYIAAGRQYTAVPSTASRIWRLGAFWKASTTHTQSNYPARVFFHEQRLWYANTPTDPVTLWSSQSADFENFAPDEGIDDYTDVKRTVTDASALTYTIASGQQNAIQWLAATGNLLVATSGKIWSMQGGQVREALKPNSINARPSNSAGAADVRPVVVADEVIYLSRSGRKVMTVGFEFERDGFVPRELSQIAGHYLLSPVTQFTYAIEPNGILWAVKADGSMVGCTYSREQQVLAWHEYVPGGSFGAGNAQIESVATINDFDDKYDVTWMVTKRTIEGITKRYIEFMVDEFDLEDALIAAHFVDCAPAPYTPASGGPLNIFSGFDHLDGETVAALADGVSYTGLTVTAGQITLPGGVTAANLIAGLPYTSEIETLPLEVRGAPGGTLIGRMKRAVDLYADVVRTNHLKVGFRKDDGTLVTDTFQFASVVDLMGDPPELHTGLIEIAPDSGYELPLTMVLTADKPVPCTLNSIVGRVEWSDRGGGTG